MVFVSNFILTLTKKPDKNLFEKCKLEKMDI